MKITGKANVISALKDGAILRSGHSGSIFLGTSDGIKIGYVHGATFNGMLTRHEIKATDVNSWPITTWILTE